MKQNLLRFYLLTALVLLCLPAAFASTTVTFDPSVDQTGENTQSYNLSLTKDGVTLDVSYGNMATTDGAYRIYKNATLKISTTLGYISAVSFSPSPLSSYPLSSFTVNTGNYEATGVWSATSDVNEVIFTASTSQVRTTLIVVSIIEPGSSDYRPTLTDGFTFWPVMDEEPTAQVTITPKTGTLCYYTTDGSAPTTSSNRTSQAVTIEIHGTTTVKAATYSNGALGDVVSRTYTLGPTYNGIGDMLTNATVGEDIRLYWSDAMNARVVFANPSATQVYIRDMTGCMLLYGFSSTPKFAKDQHVAGWIMGRVAKYGGLMQFVPNEFTNTLELVIAEPVTEEVIYPVEVDGISDFDAHNYDLVTVRNVRYDESLFNNAENTSKKYGAFDRFNDGKVRLYDRFTLSGFDYPYSGALVDLTGIAITYNGDRQVAAIDMGDYYTYVVNRDSAFNAPAADLTDVNVRLQRDRNFAKDYYAAMFLPFELNAQNFDGDIYAYTGVDTSNSNYTVVKFETVDKSTPGVPCIVKPKAEMTGVKSSGATLVSATTTPGFNGYNFIGVYDQYGCADGEHIFLGDGTFMMAESPYTSNFSYLNTSEAYFTGSSSQLKLMIDGKLVGTVVLEGDVNGDGSVNAGDVSAIYNVMLGIETDANVISAADVNGDGSVNAGDVSTVYGIMLGANASGVIVVPVNNK